ncbi:MAG: hemerythrin domain-containing protein [Magnetococcales bacterium]|nr:hemerythrin domain-containing protein [Magnetococcales bacterium]
MRREDLYQQAKESLCDVGVERFNEAHRELLYHILLLQEHLEAVLTLDDQTLDWKLVDQSIDFLETYTLEHLKAEEVLMVASHYAGYAEHKAEHEKLIVDFLEIKGRIMASRKKEDVSELKDFLLGWLFKHTSCTDMEYKGKLDLSLV